MVPGLKPSGSSKSLKSKHRKYEMMTFFKYYRGVNIEKYKDKVKKISDSYPYINNQGEII